MAVLTRATVIPSGSSLLSILLAITYFITAAGASATEVQLRQQLELDSAPVEMVSQGWTWLSLDDPSKLKDLPPEWHLLIDQVRFDEIGLVIVGSDGRPVKIFKNADELQSNWAPGGLLKFDIPRKGADIQKLYIGLKAADDLALMRKVTAASPERAFVLASQWIALMCLFTGFLVSAFIYNLVVHTRERQAFQFWYLGWVAVVLAYGLTWTNMAAYLFPGLAGPVAVTIDNILVSGAVALGAMFLLSVLERKAVSRALRSTARIVACLCFVCGIIAATDGVIEPTIGDKLLNVGMLASMTISLLVIWSAIIRQSRVIWIYLVGWMPVIVLFGLRVARNFGFVAQSDLVDHATFAAIGFEAVVFSLLIANRFSDLRRQRDVAEAEARELHIEQEALQKAAHTDFLTGLGNRASFNSALHKLWDGPVPFTLFLIDVDYLKEINDKQGHDAGDTLLSFIGAKLTAIGPEAVCSARLGGDEFAVLAIDHGGSANRIRDELKELQGSIWARGTSIGVLSLSIGMATSSQAASPTDLVKHADLALYDAKKKGRGQLRPFNDQMRLSIQTRAEMVREASQAFERSEFVLHFQPIFNLENQQASSVEALLRWNHPTRGLLAPGAFECVFEDPNIGPVIQNHVLDLAVAWLQSNASIPGSLSVNFNSMGLRGTESALHLLGVLKKAGISPSALCVEVTEGTVFGRGGDEPATAIRILHSAGVRVALDDFGTGYASLVHLKEIPVDVLKIDKSFVEGLLEDGGRSEEIVRAVLALGQGLGREVVAEGVETVDQLIRLRDLGCNFAQGYLLGKPEAAFCADEISRQAA